MEKIKKALERAREERGERPAEPEAEREPDVAASTPTTQEEPIVYDKTRTVAVGKSVLRANRIVTGDEDTPFSDAFKVLRTQVLQRMRAENWNTLAVTSPGVSAGKTVTAVNLGISLAREVDHTVLLVDADLRRPSVHAVFELRPESGLSDYLQGGVPLEDILINPGVEKFVILPGGVPVSNSSEMLDSPRMAKLVDELKTRYPGRIVLFDMPPVLQGDDALAFSPHVDAALLVVEEGVSQQAEVERAIELLQGTHLIGTVLNKSREPIRGTYPY